MLTWQEHTSWVGVFDVLGFKELIRHSDRDHPKIRLTERLGELLKSAHKRASKLDKYQIHVVSDTIVIYAPDAASSTYPLFIRACEGLIRDSIRIRLPMQGAMSMGITLTAQEYSILTGPAFVEAYEHCEAQDWVGLLLCASATQAIREAGADPLHHDYVNVPVPWRNQPPPTFVSGEVLAYRFQNGMANFSSPLIKWLEEMENFAPAKAKRKHRNTIEFIEEHYRYVS